MTACVTFFTLIKWSWSNSLKLATAALLLSFFIPAHAQVLQPLRYEVPIFQHDRFEIIPTGEFGLYLYREFSGASNDQIQLIHLDTTFQEKWAGFLPIPKNYLLMGKKAYGAKLFLLFRYRDYSRNNLLLYVINQDSGQYFQHEIKGYIPFSPSEFQITENSVLIGGYYNRIPIVIHYSLSALRSKVLPGLFNEAGELTQIRTYPDGTFDVLISALNIKRQKTIWIKNYDTTGDLIRHYSLEPSDKHLIFGRSLKIDKDMQVVAGVYGTHRHSEFSRGFFISSIEPSGLERTRYYNFGDFENFFKYMKAKREQRVKNRIERRKIKGKKIRFNYRFLVHEIVPHNGQYILLGEAFYPRYINYERSFGNSFFAPTASNVVIRNGRIFDGYYYTHAVVMGFDENGKLLWDNSFEINDVKTMTLEQFVKLEVKDDKIALLYLFDNKIRTKIIKNNQVLEGKSIDPLRTLETNDVVRKESTDKSRLEYWYKDFMYAYGVQEIVNPATKARKKVFFINKITYAD
jgi:hypothetical protein